MALQPLLALKQGVSLSLDVLVTDDLSDPVNLSGSTVQIVIADPFGNPVATVPVTPSAQMGWGTAVASTPAWPVGILMAEVWVVTGTNTMISDTFQIAIERPVTQ